MKKGIALALVLMMVLAMAPSATAAAGRLPLEVTAADVLPLAQAPNRYEPMGESTLEETSWIVPEFETYGQSAVIGDRMDIRTHVCADSVTNDGIVGMMLFKGTYDKVTENSEPVYTDAYYAVGGHSSYAKVFEWDTTGFSAGDYTAFFFVMDEEANVIFSSAADLYLSKKHIPVTGIEIYVYELQDTPEEIRLPKDGAFSYGVIYEPYHATSRSYSRSVVGDLAFGGSEKPDGRGLVKVYRVEDSATLTITFDGYQEEGGTIPTDTLTILIQDESTMATFAKNDIRSCIGAWTEVPVNIPQGIECSVYNGNPYILEIKIENNTLYARGLCRGEGELSLVSGNAIDYVEVDSGDHICEEEYRSATCTEDGYEREVCEYCGTVVSETIIAAKGHELTELETVLEPTATKDGVEVGFCTRCNTEVEVPVSRIFTDTEPDWFYSDPLDYCYENGIINGLTATTFGPTATLNRAQLVTMLYRLAGSPEVEEGTAFTDVPAGEFYTAPVAWASANGIVTGHDDGSFRPGDAITREQIVTMLHRYVVSLGKDNGERNDLAAFEDLDALSGYALEPMQWAVANGVITGMSDTVLGPQENANRAQTVTILYRIITGILEAGENA